MIRGQVVAAGRDGPVEFLTPRVTLEIAGRNRVFQAEEAYVDTGFTGWLTLPESIIQELGLTRYGRRFALLASNDISRFQVYGCLVSWHGVARPALVHQSESKPLIGMALLANSRLTVDARAGGDVVIEEL